MEGWPFRLIGACMEVGIWSTYLLRDLDNPPFALADMARH